MNSDSQNTRIIPFPTRKEYMEYNSWAFSSQQLGFKIRTSYVKYVGNFRIEVAGCWNYNYCIRDTISGISYYGDEKDYIPQDGHVTDTMAKEASFEKLQELIMKHYRFSSFEVFDWNGEMPEEFDLSEEKLLSETLSDIINTIYDKHDYTRVSADNDIAETSEGVPNYSYNAKRIYASFDRFQNYKR